ncbi:AmiS/UreI family transporter [Streptomyces tirandamycinicus]|uniref:Transporter n=1 Tax=Streptomyces tirandamycinicus TaxID=2174846 RepID=A0A2S1SLZ1_9ACTN|nr:MULTISPECIES: AmiS/UreI family transporter [Streptomyces]AWI27424.1 transporter [Streptomyces tirandamycinicus]MCY0983665.1 AmiS/UreI family transporter [Streptomyces tirandamycinicus]NNJ04913.1 transporter [Streptomyces sp. PKU-MA01144]TFE51243.1 transporter [Streptomyces sp. ICN441]
MGNVGLLFVGAVLFINGLLLLGKVDAKAGAVFNLFIGALQVLTPTYLIFTAGDDPMKILAASGIYLFGFTYLYVGIGLLTGLDSTGVGYYSLFVAIAALGYAFVNFRLFGDQAFGVIWLYWAFLWFLFFLLLGLKMDALREYTGWVTAIQGWVTGVIPAGLLLSGYWKHPTEIAIALAVFGVVVFAALWPLTRSSRQPAPASAGPPA